MDIRKVKKLIELLEESGIAEIEIHEGEESVRISRGSASTPAPATTINVPSAPAISPASEPISSHMSTDERSREDYSDEGYVIKAPMVGVFYTAPAPEEPDFASVGQTVKSGDVLCIIEAMKIMNQIESDVNGKVINILVESGEAVEYGQPLFVIEES